jgi:hypothetical protein
VQTVHGFLADVAVAVVAVAAVWCVVLAVLARPGGRWFDRLQRVIILSIAAAAAAGAIVFVLGSRPDDGLHLLYGGVAIIILPVARSFRSGASRRDALLMLAGCALLGGVLFRLFTTG